MRLRDGLRGASIALALLALGLPPRPSARALQRLGRPSESSDCDDA